MKSLVFLLLLALAIADAKVFEVCDWARTLNNHNMQSHGGVSLADWVCLTYYESSYNTKARNQNSNKSTDYGIFQINSFYWCRDGGKNRSNNCGITCDELLSDDPTAAIECAKHVADTQGMTAWVAWSRCSGRNNNHFIANCRL